MSFEKFAKLVHDRYNTLATTELFVVQQDGVDLKEVYLAAFPQGTNPIYKERTEHDCSCCKNFIRNLGAVVSLEGDVVSTVWDIDGAPYPYDVVAKRLHEVVKAMPIAGLFRTKEGRYGAPQTNQDLGEGKVKVWKHFHGAVAKPFLVPMPDTNKGQYRGSVDVFRRGLDELTMDALNDVLGLIDSNALYRGAEHKAAVTAFKQAKVYYDKLAAWQKENYVWHKAGNMAVSRFRNTVIGTLVQDLSEGKDLEQAVKSFEAKVAPTNYKRPTALITPGMVKTAMATITSLGLESSLQRRFASIDDVSVNNVLWVGNEARGKMKGGIADMLMDAAVASAPKTPNAIAIGIDEFMSSVLPVATGIELLVKGTHLNNFVSLTAPVHQDTTKLFKWANDFAWSYDGNVADSIKERVKAAGGNVTNAKLRVSLSWFNTDDLDIHVEEPNGNHIYFGNKCHKLDVDMNAGYGHTRKPVENVSWTQVADGNYRVLIDQFSQRETTDIGCVVEIESAGQLVQLSYAKALKKMTRFCHLTLKNGVVTRIEPAAGVVGGGISQDKWGVSTEKFAKVNTLMHSPNYWDGNAVGNKHYFFMLDGCKNSEDTRGIYNEFLASGLEQHRKVFEVLGDKTKCVPTDDQLSGLGFSSTRGDKVTVKVTGPKINKVYEVTF